MNHYVLTTSAYSPAYPETANRRRVALTRGITARSLGAQSGDWTWLVYVNPADPLLDERLDAFRSAGRPVVADVDPTRAIDWSGDVLTTRLDDDDAFAVDAFARLRSAIRGRAAYVFRRGYRVGAGRSLLMDHPTNQWVSLFAPAGERVHVRMRQHNHVADLAPVRYIDDRPAFLWVRHPDTATTYRGARDAIPSSVRRAFAIDWSLVCTT